MRKMMLLVALVAIAALMLAAAPAFADDNNHNDFCDFHDCNNHNDFCDFHDCNNHNDFFDHNINNRNDVCDFFDINNCNRFFNNNFNNRPFVRPFANFNNEISQENEQEVESGDATQNINVTGGGANSNQCAGVQGVTNTGNATNNTSVLQAGGFDGNNNNGFFDGNGFRHHRFFDGNRFNDGFNNGGDVEVNDVGNLEISPSNSTSCTQQVNQAATAAG